MSGPCKAPELWACFRSEAHAIRWSDPHEVIVVARRLLVDWGSNRLAMRDILAEGVKLGEISEATLPLWNSLGSSWAAMESPGNKEESRSPPSSPPLPPAGEAQQALCLHAPTDILGFRALQNHAAGLKKQALLTFSSLTDVAPGKPLHEAALHLLERAAIVVVLLSADLFADEWLFELVSRALGRHQQGLLTMIPVCYRPVDVSSYGLDALAPLPGSRMAVSVSPDPDTAWLAVVNGLRARLKYLRAGADART